MKKLLSVLLLLLALFIVGCGDDEKEGEGDTGKTEPVTLTVQDVSTYIANTKKAYSDSENGSVQVTMTNGEIVSTLKLQYNYELAKSNVSTLAVELKNALGEISVYIEDSKAYMNRYGEKTSARVNANEGLQIVEDYGFDAFTDALFFILGPSFFESATVASVENNVATVNLNLVDYQVSEDETYDGDDLLKLYDLVESMAEKKEVKLLVTYVETAVTKLELQLVNQDDSVAKISVEFLGTDLVNIEFPDLTTY